MNEREPKYIRKSFTLEQEMINRIREAAARRVQCGLDGGSSSAIVRIAVNKFLIEWDECQLKGTDAKTVD
jgi:hypothetical protein